MLWHSNSNNQFTPPYDVVELSDQIVILIEVAGMNSTDIRISLASGRLVVSGTRHRPTFEGAAHHRVEIGYGEFRLEIPLLWSVLREEVTATYRDGFLQIELPRRGEKKIRVVNVESTQGDIADGK